MSIFPSKKSSFSIQRGTGLFLVACLGLATASSCAAKQKQSEDSAPIKAVAYRVNITNESTHPVRYRYARLVPHQSNPMPRDPQPQATLDVGFVFETIAPGKSTNVTLAPGKKLTLVLLKKGIDERRTLKINQSMDLYVTDSGLYEQKNDARVLIQVK